MKNWVEQFFIIDDNEYVSKNILEYWNQSNVKTINFVFMLNKFFENVKNKELNIDKVLKYKSKIKKDLPAFFITINFLEQIGLNYNFFIFVFIISNNKNKNEIFDLYIKKNYLKYEFLILFSTYLKKKIILNETYEFIIYNENEKKFYNKELNIKLFVEKDEYISNNIEIIR